MLASVTRMARYTAAMLKYWLLIDSTGQHTNPPCFSLLSIIGANSPTSAS